ncbi:hypothetical protein BGW36DRAFT_361593 [Talaromyces proteolyticus]|uniref:Uncharacterized protein n=1 Tax=Talaromyces proteolyticus TaxID=1131652 RepID=A0AAD4KJH1_9EURO|nr:uncharacterized protein BGW36DRAFT_361593 [Talaromyces proteolyticus]KAH8693751.1 hypothetical protein BGW36DRAFT_361593 [Talaromyces proteolyticus]
MKPGPGFQGMAVLSAMAVGYARPHEIHKANSLSVDEWYGLVDVAPNKRKIDSNSSTKVNGVGTIASDKRNIASTSATKQKMTGSKTSCKPTLDSIPSAKQDGGGDMAPNKLEYPTHNVSI